MASRRGATNRNQRGGAVARRRRRQWLLDQFGDGTVANCARCGHIVDIETLSVDRIKPGIEGGTYRRDNIQPACTPCNSSSGGKLGVQRKKARKT